MKKQKGNFTSLMFREGHTTSVYAAEIIKLTSERVKFRCKYSGEVLEKPLANIIAG